MGKLKEIKNGRLAMFAMLGITYRQLQQERVQLLIGQSTLQIQEQSTLGTMQQSSLQHYSVMQMLVWRLYGDTWWWGHCSVRIQTNLCSVMAGFMQITRKSLLGNLQALSVTSCKSIRIN